MRWVRARRGGESFMAKPDRPGSSNPRTERKGFGRRQDDFERRRVVYRGGSLGWSWLWIIILCVAFLWFAGWGWGGYGGWWWGGRGVYGYYHNGRNANNAGNRTTGTNTNAATGAGSANGSGTAPGARGTALLNSTDKLAYVGQQIALDNVAVKDEPTDDVAWISGKNGERMLIVLTGNGNLANGRLTPGENIDVTGTVEKAPAQSQAQKEWRLSNQGANELEQEQVYLQATGFKVSGGPAW